jgi:hypothetical protein
MLGSGRRNGSAQLGRTWGYEEGQKRTRTGLRLQVPSALVRRPAPPVSSPVSIVKAPTLVRRNIPTINYKIRGSMPTEALTVEERVRIVKELEDDVLAPSTVEAWAANYRTWIAFHVRWSGEAKARHLEHFEWNVALQKCRRDCIQSTQRGIGPALQCMEPPPYGRCLTWG